MGKILPFHPPSGEILPIQTTALLTGGGDGTSSDMADRLSKLEGQQEGIKQSQNILVMAVGAVSAILIALGIYTVARLDSLSGQVGALPDQINTKLMDISKLLAEQTMATRLMNQQPTVVVVPQPPSPSVQPDAKKP